MSLTIREVILYHRSGATRSVALRPGVNIITGKSGTGKSALIDIVDYCLGRSTFTIPEGVIREHVAWYAVLFSTGETDVFVAKPSPREGAESQSTAHFQVGTALEVPALDDLRADSNDASVISSISALLGIAEASAQLSEASSRTAYQVHLRHCAHYLYQPQSIVASREVLFYQQQEDWATQTIKDTLPYFLGAVTEERLALLRDLRLARRELARRKRELDEFEQLASQGLQRGRALVAEATQAGILEPAAEDIPEADIIARLQEAVAWRPGASQEVSQDRVPRLQNERASLSRQLSAVGERIAAARAFASSSGGYSSEAEAQARRLESVSILGPSEEVVRCPVCQSHVEDRFPTLEVVEQSLHRLNEELSRVEKERPEIEKHITALEMEQEGLKGQIQELDLEINALIREASSARELQDQNARAARVVGRISLYLDTVAVRSAPSNPQEEYEVAERRVNALSEELENWDVGEIQDSYLNRIGKDMSALASWLPFEHSEWPLRLDPRKMTVVADRPGRPFPMSRMGSGQNFLICHVSCLLGLHAHFRRENRPVPGFLFLDQPSQVYFPSRDEYRNLSGSIEETEASNADLSSTRRLFETIFNAVDTLIPDFQLIVLEHANLESERFQEALVETPWRDRGLVPSEWME